MESEPVIPWSDAKLAGTLRGTQHFKKIKLYTNSNNNQLIDTVSKRMRV